MDVRLIIDSAIKPPMKYLKTLFLFTSLIQASVHSVYAAPEFKGISAGDMTENGAILWTQVTNGGQVTPLTLQVSTDSSFASGVSSFNTATVVENGSTAKTALSGLSSNTQYFYRYTGGGATSDVGRFFTTPSANQMVPFKMGFTGDYDALYRPYSTLANFGNPTLNPGSKNLNVFINLGDLMYERRANGSPATPSLSPNSSASDVDAATVDYYRKYTEGITGVDANGNMSSSGNQGMRSMLASTGVYSLLDNHELNGAMISGGAAQTSDKENLDLSQAVNNTGSYINQTDAFRMMTKTFYDTHATGVQISGSATNGYSFENLTTPTIPTVNAPTDSRTNGTAQNFFTRSWGQAATYIQLDDRSYRDARMGDDDVSLASVVANDPNRTMLGTTQYDWLKTQLLAAKNNSTWTVVSVSTPIDQWDPNDNKSWLAGYNYERNNLMKFIADNEIKHVVFLTTDDHMNRVTQLKYQENPSNPDDPWLPVPGAFQVLSAPAGAVGPYFNAMDFGGFGIEASRTVLNNQSLKQPNQDAMGVGLMGMNGLANVYRVGDANATTTPTAIDFFTATQYGYSTLEWDRFANLRVKYWGIDAYAPNSYPSATPTPYLVLSFGVHVPYTVATGSSIALTDADFIDAEVPIPINRQFNASWMVNGGLDISGMGGGGVAFNGISGDSTGTISLGAKTLTVTNAADTFAGVISGTGGLSVAGGRQVLSGVNTYTGATSISSDATLALSGLGSISGSSGILNNGLFEVSASTNPVLVNAITGSGAVLVNGGALVLEDINGYTGATTIQAGSIFALQGIGEISATSPISNGGVFSITGKSVDVTVGSYTQTPSGTLAMNFSPTANQKMNISGPASIAGGLNLSLSAGAYTPGRYTFLSSTEGLTGSFSSLARNISPYTPYAYNLGYTSSEAYLTLYDFYLADTQQSLINTSAALQNSFILQNSVLVNSFSYDCTEFGPNGICISVGGRNTAVQAANGLNNTSALLIAAYKVHPQVRIGAYADQNLSVNNPGNTVNLSNNTPLIGLFGAWNERLDGTGAELKFSAAYGEKNSTITRQAVGTSEVGIGSSSIISQGAQATIKYGFGVSPNVIISPYVGMRYTQNNMGGYTEGASSTVTVPLSYSALNTNATTALAGLGASYRFIPQATLFASAGIESDTNTSNGSYVATGVMHLDPVNFNPNPVKTRPTATVGAYYDLVKNQRIGITGIYRQEPYQAVSTTSVMATYTIGL